VSRHASDPRVLAFRRGSELINLKNLSGAAVRLPPDCEVLLASADVSSGELPNDASVWLRPVTDARSGERGRLPDDR